MGRADHKHDELAGLRPVLELKSTIIKVLELQKGDKVSYNCTYTAPRAMRIGVLPLGFYEGVPRALSNEGVVTTAGGAELPIVGRVCMNHTMVDLGNNDLKVGDAVVVISGNPEAPNSVAGLAEHHKLFAYTTLTGLSSSIRRAVI